MNVMLATLPLPSVLDRPTDARTHRRYCIEEFRLTDSAVCAFNRTLEKLGRTSPPLQCDDVATAARQLLDDASDVPNCIRQRMRRARAASRMLDDAGWDVAERVSEALHRIQEYVRGSDDLIPDWLPHVGRLDDALVIDTAWPGIVDEFEDYLDFRRLRRQLAAERPMRGFDRQAWLSALIEEAALDRQLERVREHSYQPYACAMFAVH